MTAFHDALPTLASEAIEVARAFTIGELEPRLVAGDDSPLHFLPMADAGRAAPLALYLLVDVGMPNRFVRIALARGAGGEPRLGAAELWRASADEVATGADGYVPLFDELSAQLYA